MKEIGIGLLGFGTVGAGVVEGLLRNGDLIAKRTGLRLVLRKIADLDLERDRGVAVDRSLLTADAAAVISDPAVDVIVELVGGLGVARTFILQALRLGKPVVTANKALLAEHGDEIFAAAAEGNTDLFYEASVGGGIPIIRSLREGLIANHIESIHAILNGTCNYILTRMEQEGLPFDQVLAAAQAAGFAEADPGLDIDGVDTAHKAVILARLAYGFPVKMSDLYLEGIRGVHAMDITCAAELGYRLKLLAVIKHQEGGVEVRVHPALVPMDHMLAKVSGVFNAIMVKGDVVGDTLYYGRGAGRLPTASAVLSDLADAARNLAAQSAQRVPAFVAHQHYGQLRRIGRTKLRCYFRLSLLDRPGVLARVAEILGRHQISIASLLQKEERAEDYVPVIMLTHVSSEENFQAAQREIDALDLVGAPTVRIRIEDF
jgi:homoserine dehydrogenase